MRYIANIAAVLLAFLALQCAVYADSVLLNNGDRITGVIEGIGDGKLRVTTDYAGTLEIGLEHVQGLDTDAPRCAVQPDGTMLDGTFQYTDEGQRLVTDAGPRAVDLTALEGLAADQAALEAGIRRKNRVWSGSVASGTTLRRGTTDTFDATLDVEFVRDKPSNKLTLTLNSAYGESEDTLTTQRIYGAAKWQFYPTEARFYWYALLSAEHDKPRLLDLRKTGGLGIGYDFIETERRKLSGELGLEYNDERWLNYAPGAYNAARAAAYTASLAQLQGLLDDVAANGLTPQNIPGIPRTVYALFNPDLLDKTRDENYLSGRLSANFETAVFKNSTLTDALTALPDFGDFGEFRLTNALAFTTPVTESIDLRLHLRTEYDSDPGAEDADNWDNTLTAGVRWGF